MHFSEKPIIKILACASIIIMMSSLITAGAVSCNALTSAETPTASCDTLANCGQANCNSCDCESIADCDKANCECDSCNCDSIADCGQANCNSCDCESIADCD
ncbi:hypothetical protein, partial [Methanosarcina sp. 2.H.T.1A.15]